MDDTVVIIKSNSVVYPNKKSAFSPSDLYPEYPWKKATLSKKTNEIYQMVRESLYQLRLDTKNYGTKKWNPLKEVVKPGMNVVIKPNMVISRDRRKIDPKLTSMVTHPSIVRAIIDYVFIALNGKGKITIADAPIQSCNFEELRKKVGYDKIQDFFKENSQLNINVIDLRQYVSKYVKNDILEPQKASSDPLGYTIVSMKKNSCHREGSNKSNKYRVTNYDHRKMILYHNETDNNYLISNTILNADVIISIPKLKTHRKAGMTCALKNFIGIIGHKDCLPHHSTGSISEGGDEYLHKNVFKKIYVKLTEQLNLAMIYKKAWIIPVLLTLINKFRYLTYRTQKDTFFEGSWYGNDTVWRTTLDLVRIVFYSDKKGVLSSKQDFYQRKIFTIVDGIIAGEKEGPLEATPKKSGIIVAGFSPLSIDYTLSSVMGFDYKCIPTINKAFIKRTYPICGYNQRKKVIIKSNYKIWNNKKPTNIKFSQSLKFIPSMGWINHIENKHNT